MEIQVLLFVRNELFYLARSSSLEALSYPSCCCLCRSVPVKKSSIFKAGKLLLVHVALSSWIAESQMAPTWLLHCSERWRWTQPEPWTEKLQWRGSSRGSKWNSLNVNVGWLYCRRRIAFSTSAVTLVSMKKSARAATAKPTAMHRIRKPTK